MLQDYGITTAIVNRVETTPQWIRENICRTILNHSLHHEGTELPVNRTPADLVQIVELVRTDASICCRLLMLSLLDVVLGVPMILLVDSLPLEPDMKAALLGAGGPLSPALDLVHGHETGDWDGHQEIQKMLHISELKASTLYIDSVVWADRALRV